MSTASISDDPADGITIRVPAARAAAVPPEATQWLVPGMLREKITALIRNLPKNHRKRLVPVADTVDVIMAEMPRTGTSLISALGRFLHQRYGVDIPAEAWSDRPLPRHLKARIALVDADGREIGSSRDPAILKTKAEDASAPDALGRLKQQWERTDIAAWDLPDLPDAIALPGRPGWSAFPGLSVENDQICLRLFQDARTAQTAHCQGVAALLSKRLSKDLGFLKRALKLPPQAAPWARTFGGAAGIEAQCQALVKETLMKKNVRSQEDYDALAERVASQLLPHGRALLESVLEVLESCHETLAELGRTARQHMGRPPLIAFIQARQADLDRLVPGNFIELYGQGPMANLCRYTRAMALRTRRGLVDLEKDSAKARSVAPFTQALQELARSLTAETSAEKRQAVEDFFWLLEEFKVSVFAQELKTALPVSKKRLEKRLAEIRRMD